MATEQRLHELTQKVARAFDRLWLPKLSGYYDALIEAYRILEENAAAARHEAEQLAADATPPDYSI